MALWDDIGRNVGNFFGGIFGGNDRKKKEDEENNFSRPTSSSLTIPVRNAPAGQSQQQIQVQKPKNIFDSSAGLSVNLRSPGSATTKVEVKPNRPSKQDELNQLYKQNLSTAREEAKRQDEASAPKDFFGKFWRWTGLDGSREATENMAETTARNRASQQYQERHGWNRDKAVLDFNKRTSQAADEAVQQSKNRIGDTKKVVDVIRYVPGAGIGELGANVIRGNFSGSREADDRLLTEQMDLTPAQIKSLSPDDRSKYLTFAKAGLGAGVLDFAGLGAGSLVKSTAKGGLKQAIEMGAKTNIRNVLKDVTTRQGAKAIATNAGIGAGSGAAISAGGAKVMGADDEDTLQAAVRGGFGGLFGGLASSPLDIATTSLARGKNARNAVRRATNEADTTVNAGAPKITSIKVQQPRGIDVTDASGEMANIPVREDNTPPVPIKELAGDTPGVNQVKVPTAQEKASEQFSSQPSARPDQRIEGITPRNPAEGITRDELNKEMEDLQLQYAGGNIDDKTLAESMKALNDITPIGEADPNATKIRVQEAQNIPVIDKTEVPVGIPETPGTVRFTKSASANKMRTEQAARQVPVSLPPETQEILDNPRKFTKAQVTAARNQRKLALQMAKTQEQTAEALTRIDSASPAAQSGEGFVPTGEFGKSVNGGAYQKTNRQAEMQQAVQETANLSPVDVLRTARTNQADTGGFNRRDIRNIAALFEQKRIVRGTPEWNEARQILKEDGTVWGQTGALRNYTMRRNASSDELISRYESKIYRLADDPSKIDSSLFDQVDAAETNFVDTRDAALRAYNMFTENPTSVNAKAYHTAQDAADQADVAAKQVEYTVAQKALKGNKDIQQARELEKMAQSADMYQMDAVDASMLSGTGTFVRNFINAGVGNLEEGMFGKAAARIASITPNARRNDIKVGGGGLFGGFKKGAMNVVDASKARAGAAGKNPLEHLKNWATTGNQLGDSVIDSQTARSTLDHYTQMLKSEGYRGRELRDRASVMARQDPNNVSDVYSKSARVAAGLGNGVTRNNKVETLIKNVISDGISGGNPNKYTENIAKLVTRLTLGFPTAIGRSVVEGAKRFTLGAPTFIRALATKDPQERAVLVKEAIKQAGTGAVVIPPMFYALGESGAITGSYPDDQEERDRWAREGITENSIKIGDDYYQLPAYLGSWAIPGLFYASLGRNGGDWGAAAADVAKAAPDLLPTGGIDSVLDVVNGRKDLGKYMSQLIPSAVRASTPAGALLNQLAKSFDPTQNDTNSGDVMSDIVAKIMSGVPVASNLLPDKTDSEGNILSNPNPLSLALGASSTEQAAGVQQTEKLNEQTNSSIQAMSELGAFSDPNLKAIVTDNEDKKIYQDILAGKQVNPDDLEKLQKAMTKGVSSDGTDTAYLEREQYDTNLAVLNMKRQLMAADPTVRPSSLEKLDVAIKRGTVYRDNEIPYDVIKSYQDTSLNEWRDMGDPESDGYDPEQYQKLWAIDEMMAKAGVSYKSGSLDKQKYYEKKAGKGRGGSRSFSSDFGKLGELKGAPSIQAYDTIEQQSGSVPVIQRERPNIVHKIGFSG